MSHKMSQHYIYDDVAGNIINQGSLVLTWFNFNPGMD